MLTDRGRLAPRPRRRDLPRRVGVRVEGALPGRDRARARRARARRSGSGCSTARCRSGARSAAASGSPGTTCPSSSSSTPRAGCPRARSSLRERIARLGERETPLVQPPRPPAGPLPAPAVPRGRYPIEEREVVLEDPFGLERRRGRRSPASALDPRLPAARRRSTGSSRSPARARPRGGGCSCAGRPASTSTACATTSRASRCAACTGRRPPGAGT